MCSSAMRVRRLKLSIPSCARFSAGADELGRINPLFLGLRDLFEPLASAGPALQFGGVALHPGALAAYREALLLP